MLKDQKGCLTLGIKMATGWYTMDLCIFLSF